MKKLAKLLKLLLVRRFRTALMSQRVAAAVEHQDLFHRISPATVVDIGANRGQFALAAREAFPSAFIFSFEPIPSAVERYSAVLGSDKAVKIFSVAIGPERHVAEIHLSAKEDSSSLLPIGSEQSAVFPGTQEIATSRVQVCRLNDCVTACELASPALLKLDVQGYEMSALLGCEDLLSHFSHVYVECSFVELYEGQALSDEVISWLRTKGFKLIGIYNLTYDRSRRPIQADFLFAS